MRRISSRSCAVARVLFCSGTSRYGSRHSSCWRGVVAFDHGNVVGLLVLDEETGVLGLRVQRVEGDDRASEVEWGEQGFEGGDLVGRVADLALGDDLAVRGHGGEEVDLGVVWSPGTADGLAVGGKRAQRLPGRSLGWCRLAAMDFAPASTAHAASARTKARGWRRPAGRLGSGTAARCWSRPGCSTGAGGDAVASGLRPVGIHDDGLAGTVFRCGDRRLDTS
jgi:hypothetical protein